MGYFCGSSGLFRLGYCKMGFVYHLAIFLHVFMQVSCCKYMCKFKIYGTFYKTPILSFNFLPPPVPLYALDRLEIWWCQKYNSGDHNIGTHLLILADGVLSSQYYCAFRKLYVHCMLVSYIRPTNFKPGRIKLRQLLVFRIQI